MLYPRKYGQNPLYPQAKDFRVVAKNESIGNGVIALRAFRRADVLAVLNGELVPEIGQHTLQVSPDSHLYDPYFSGYFLHSCAPNISVDMEKLTVTALTDIPADSFLFMDYAETEDVLFKQFTCRCGSPGCRGLITGRKEMARGIAAKSLAGLSE